MKLKRVPIFFGFSGKKFYWNCSLLISFLLLLFPTVLAVFSQENSEDMPHNEVENWAHIIGTHVFHLLNVVARYSEIEKNFRDQKATISDNDGLTLVKQMAEDVTNMMKYKVQAVKRIMNVAEEVSQDPSYLQDEWKGYYNAKFVNEPAERIVELEKRYDYDQDKIAEYYGTKFKELFTRLDLTPNEHFDNQPISLNVSTVHVPTNVFEGGPNVRKAIRWSEALDKTFYSNYEHDPTLSWQYFGSATGFLRQFPGGRWDMDAEDPDLYDSRLRSWYIQAANSPKDMVILLDISGSMTGLRKEIAKHVVLNILETLNENDYVNIFTFSDVTKELVPCFNDTLVQANLENIGEFKQELDDLKTENIANFSLALTKAFKLLQKHNKIGHGSQCNQAIMLVTDGAPYTYDSIFNEYNWPHLQIRLFTYLIGREVTEVRSLSWMACANKGYFVHVTTPSEVREQVLKYIPVVARPMVMYQDKHPIIWTGVYADIADPKQTNWLWELRERDRQMRRTNNYRKLKRLVESKEFLKYDYVSKDFKEIEKYLLYGKFNLSDREIAQMKAERARKIRITHDHPHKYERNKWTLYVGRDEKVGRKHGYKLMTTVSVPVFNRTQSAERVADLLGVAGTDVPIREIEKLVPPYKLGVNGYSFMVNKNGYILYHPDLRPTFQDILKPNYNSVDLAEVELVDVSDDPRQNHSDLNTLRRDMIEQRSSETNFKVRIHIDDMKRVELRNQRYFTSKISESPFSLGISLPDGYGKYKVDGQIELSLAMKDNVHFNASDYFSSGNWSLHPDWVYCEYKYDQGVERSPEELMLHFLAKAQMPGWKWRSTRTRPPPDSTQSKGHQGQYDETDYYCDKDLIQNLLFDAQATDVYNKTKQKESFTDDKNHGKHKNFGISSVFVSTRSGLSRWLDIGDDLSYSEENPHFMKIHDRAIDEVWYKRAVDYYKEDTEAYVYSVPFDAATRDPSQVYVTASRAIFIRQNKFQQAPAAVVGVNIKLDKFVEFFKNETYACRQYSQRHSVCQKEMTCKSEFLDCYLLDDSGFVVASEKMHEIGKFFGEIEGTIMESLVQSDVYNRIKIYDYQAVCLDVVNEGSFASILLTPLELLKWTTKWVVGNMMWVLVKTQLYHLWDPNEAWAYSSYGGDKGTNYQDYDHAPPVQPSDFGTIVTDEEINIEVKNTSLNTTTESEAPVFDEFEMTHEYEIVELKNTSLNTTTESEAPVFDDFEITHEYEIVELNETSIEIINSTLYNATKYNENETTEFEDHYEEIPVEDYDISNEEVWNTPIEDGEDFPRLQLAFINKTRPRPCDKEVNLYKLNNSKLKETKSDKFKPVKGKLSNCHSNGCGRPFSVQKVIQTNLVLIVVHNLCPCESRTVGIDPIEVASTSATHCEKLLQKHFRERPSECYNYHPDEASIKACGGCSRIPIPSVLVLLLISLFLCANSCVNRT